MGATAEAPDADPSPDELTRFCALRDALRRLAAMLTDDARPAAVSATTDIDQAVADVDDAAALAPICACYAPGRVLCRLGGVSGGRFIKSGWMTK